MRYFRLWLPLYSEQVLEFQQRYQTFPVQKKYINKKKERKNKENNKHIHEIQKLAEVGFRFSSFATLQRITQIVNSE